MGGSVPHVAEPVRSHDRSRVKNTTCSDPAAFEDRSQRKEPAVLADFDVAADVGSRPDHRAGSHPSARLNRRTRRYGNAGSQPSVGIDMGTPRDTGGGRVRRMEVREPDRDGHSRVRDYDRGPPPRHALVRYEESTRAACGRLLRPPGTGDPGEVLRARALERLEP